MKNATVKPYTCLVFDADHTLLDYLTDERAAFGALYEEMGVTPSAELFAFSRFASEDTWTAAGLYDVHSEDVQRRYHTVYRTHVTDIFRRIYERFPQTFVDVPISAQTAGEKFLSYLEREGALLPQAKQTLAALAKRYRICIATNGITPVQRGRLRSLTPLVEKIFISEELGAIKPQTAFFKRLLAEMGVEKAECLMIGDSLQSDVAGAKAAGIDSCWLSGGKENTTPFRPDYTVRELKELLEILL